MDFEDLIFEQDGLIAIIILNRPDRLNALNTNLIVNELPRAMREIQANDEIRVVILTGAGRGFCSGIDVAERLQRVPQIRSEYTTPIGSIGLEIRRIRKPIIAAVNGVAAGAGVALCLLCDIRIASDRASVNLAYVRRGLVPDWGMTYLLPRIVGTEKALELLWTGDTIDAQEAQRIGLVGKVVPHDDLLKLSKEFANKLARGPSVAIELTKVGVYRGLDNDYESQLYFENYAQKICAATDDFREGVDSFLEKREPRFKGM